MALSERRSRIEQLIADGKLVMAAQELARLFETEPSAAAFIASRYKVIGKGLDLTPYRLAIERSFTLEPVLPYLKAAALISGIDLAVHLGSFNGYAQEILDPQSDLYRFNPDVVVLAALTSDIAPELWSWSKHTAESSRDAVVRRVVSRFQDLIAAFRANSASYLVVHLLERPAFQVRGILDNQLHESRTATIEQINDELRELARQQKGVYTLDYGGLISRYGSLNWRDALKWQSFRMPIRSEFFKPLAEEWLRFLHPMVGKIAKVVAVDLDNTLWGGVVGEDGLSGIKLGSEHPDIAYRSVQQALLELLDRGLLLAICSKNNLDDVTEVFEKHPEMLLRLDHFSAVRINWQEKSENLRSIAAELNVGLDAVAFVDDNPVERQQVRSALPQVHVLELPQNAAYYEGALRSYGPFERLILSTEDRQRRDYYAAQGRVAELKSQSSTREEFLVSLQQKVTIQAVTNITLARAAQLTQKTNQFNLTTRRYSEQQIEVLLASADWKTYTIRAMDRYADNGVIGVAFVQDTQDTCRIDTFLLSCRVIGREIEKALLSYIVGKARDRGIRYISGQFTRTPKNQPASDFFSQHGFTLSEETPETSSWRLDLLERDVTWPPWIELSREELHA